MKRCLALLLALVMVITCLPVNAFAATVVASGACGDNATWSLTDDGTITISGTGDMCEISDNNQQPWYSNMSAITSVVVETGITSISDFAFYGCTDLTNVTLPEGLISIGAAAFNGCTGLTGITFPEGITVIGAESFHGCTNLTGVTIPEGVDCINAGAFAGTAITEIVIPDSVTVIHSDAFGNCASLKTVTVGAGITDVYYRAFVDCTALNRITFTSDAPAIDEAFGGVTATVSYPENRSGWDTVAGNNYGGTLTWEPYTMGVGGDDSDSATEVASGACGDNLTWVLTNDGALTISGQGDMYDYAAGGAPWYSYATDIIKAFLNDGVTTVGDYAFYGCDAITQLYIPSTITAFGDNAFQGVTADTFYADDFDSSLIGNYGGNLNWVLLPSESPDGDDSDSATEVASGQCGDNAYWSLSSDGILTITGEGAMYDYPNGFVDAPWGDYRMDIFKILIGDDITYVGQMAFEGCEGGVNEIYIGVSVQTIGEGAFFGACNGVTTLFIPESCTTISSKAFYGCASLTDLYIYGDNVTIGSQAFANGAFNGSMSVRFEGTAGSIDATAFEAVTAAVSYPAGDTSWDSVVGNNYGGTLTWTAYSRVCDGCVIAAVNGFDGCTDGNGLLHICNNNFPDGNFRNYISANFDADSDGYLSAAELADVQNIDCTDMGIRRIKGVEFFGDLISLNVDTNLISSVDLFGNTKLEYLNLRNNELTSVDVTMLPELVEALFCMNQLTSLDVSQNTKLEQLSFPENQLTSIDLSNNPNIWWLVCYMNQLTALDVTGLANLTWLDCDENQITSLDVTQNTKLETLLCASNQLGSLDITQNTALVDLHAANCGLTALDITQNADLQALRVNNNHNIVITGINNACHEDLLWLDYGNCGITIDFSKMTQLQSLQCYSNNLTSLDVSMLPDLVELTCSENQIKALDVSMLSDLELLHCANNQLVELDLSNNPNLRTLYCNNQYYDGTFPTVTQNANGEYEIAMYDYVADYSRIQAIEPITGSASYDATTGIATFDTDPTADGFWYHYDMGISLVSGYYLRVGMGPVPYEDMGGIENGTVNDGSGSSGGSSGSSEANPFTPNASCTDSTSDLLHICQYNFPDAQFMNYVQQYGGDWDGDGYLTRSEAGSVWTIACEDWGIASLEGIQYFTQLRELYAMSNAITALDLSGNPYLEQLMLDNNKLTGLDLSANTNLRYLNVMTNQLTSLDVSMLPNLEGLLYNDNQVGTVDLANNPNLRELHCINTGISSLDVSMLPNLQNLYCSDNDLTSLDLSNNPSLKDLGVDSNENLTTLTLAAGTSLRHVDYSHTALTFDITAHPDLEVLRCSGMGLTSVDFSQNTALKELSLNENALTSIDVSMLPNLESLDIMINSIGSLDLSANTALRDLYVDQNALAELDLSANGNLQSGFFGEQYIQKSVGWTQNADGAYEVDMSQYVSDVARINRVENADNYDSATGIATFGGEPSEVVYAYDTGWNGEELRVIISTNCTHSWNIVDCYNIVCTRCGATETGEYHEWNVADCYNIVCVRCGYSEPGEYHNWQAATCQTPATCSVCGATDGTVSGCSYGAWTTTVAPTTTAAGERSRACVWCGATETAAIPMLTDDGSVIMENITDAGNNDLGASVEVSYAAIENGEAAGDYVTVELTVEEVSGEDIDADTMTQLEEQANFIVSGLDQRFSNTGAVFMDINLYKQVGTDDAEAVTETNEAVTITIEVPDYLRSQSMLFYIIRVHNGVAEVLPCAYDDLSGTLTFETDCFSNYTLFWVQTESGDEGGEEGGDTETEFFDLELGEQGHAVEAEQVLYFQWIAPEEGDFTLSMLCDSWLYAMVVNHADGSSEETPEFSSLDEEPVSSTTFHVYEGSTVLVAVTTADFTAGEINLRAEFTPAQAEVSYVAQVGETKYETLVEAVEAAEEGATVTLLADATGAGAVIDKSITIDLGGYTYTFNKTVGSAGTTTLGFQILKDNDVVIKNGTLTSTDVTEGKEVKVLIQNYANLTLTDVALVDNTDHILYCLSNNCGNVVLDGATTITTDAVAFDVYDYSSAGYTLPVVTVADTVMITGTVEAVAKVGNVYYASLAEAIEAAEEGATVTLLADATGAGVVIDKSITIDLGGYTYTFNKTVGSAGTTTLGFQILKDNDVVIKNGTLTSTAVTEGKEVKVLIQNYANLTLTDVNLVDDTEHILYCLSNNCGTIELNGNTNITTDAVAFDVYDYSSAGYALPEMVVNTTGTISGEIEVSDTVSLTIYSGSYTVDVNEWCAEGYIATADDEGIYTVKVGAWVAEVNGVKYETLADALAAAVSGDVVEVIADTADGYLIIAPGVTLDLNGHTVEAQYVIGLNGSYLTADDNSGKLIVAQDNIALSTNGYINQDGYYVLPVWDTDHFVFSRFAINTDTDKDRGLTVDEEAEKIYFQFKHQATGAINKSLLADGCSDNELSVIVRLTWTNEQGTASQDFVYNDGFVGEVVGGNDYTFTLTGYTALNIDLDTLVVQAMIVTDSGATAFGAEWEAQ